MTHAAASAALVLELIASVGCASNDEAPQNQAGSPAGGGGGGSGHAGTGFGGATGGRSGAGGGTNGGATATAGSGQSGTPGGSGASGSAGQSGGRSGASGGGRRGGAAAGGDLGTGGMSGASGSAGAGRVGAGGAAATGGRAGSGGADASGGAGASGGAAGVTGPCDIYAAGSTPCVAAHSTVRALFGSYSGKLYQVQRASDKTTKDISVLTPGGFADAAAQDAFCMGTTCTVPILYDQSGKGNHLTVAPAGGNGSADVAANATSLKLTVGGNTVYAIYVSAGVGYRNNSTSGIATGSGAEGEYMVASGTHVNDGCCFDYGNAETNNKDTGNGHMEAIYLGKLCWFTPCQGSGPWVMGDLENGLFAGANGSNSKNTSVAYDYVTAMLKGNSSGYAIKGGNAQTGSLKVMYDGVLPTTTGYNPMHKEGAIILGIGGDNSKVAVGTFFEGAMSSGYPTSDTDDAVQANIVAAGYGG